MCVEYKQSYELVDWSCYDLVADVVVVAASWRWAKGVRQYSVTVKPRQQKVKEGAAKLQLKSIRRKVMKKELKIWRSRYEA